MGSLSSFKSREKFQIWVSSYFLNESELPPQKLAADLLEHWDEVLDHKALILILEPGTREISRKLLEMRKEWLEPFSERKYEIWLPCLGHQACGALARPGDWCHQRISWWRPPYIHALDRLLGWDHRELDFSYFVIGKNMPSPLSAPLPRHRVVSDPVRSKKVKKHSEAYLCGEDGKRIFRLGGLEEEVIRGDILHSGIPDLKKNPPHWMKPEKI